jgi:hypothetical protein
LRDVHEAKIELKREEDAVAIKHLLRVNFRKYPFGFGRLKKALAEARDISYNGALKKPTYKQLLNEAETAHQADDAGPDFSDPKLVLKWLEETEIARQRESAAKVKATARSIADRIGAGESL